MQKERRKVKKYCMVFELKEEYVKDYADLHKNCSKEYIKALKDCGIEDMSIFIYGNKTIIFYNCEDLNGWLKKLLDTKENKEWQKIINPLFKNIPSFEGSYEESSLEKVFDISEI